MDYDTAHQFLLTQGQLDSPDPDQFLVRLRQAKPPVPGQVTTILLALKVVLEDLRGVPTLDRTLAANLYRLANDSRHWFNTGRSRGVDWPPLLDEDLQRIAIAVQQIFADS
jgi:hypothetical protein